MGKWDMVRLGDVCVIERGGSPRPIDKYITYNASGINWIKIGDTTPTSMYITHTKEKIIPEGMKKSRYVKPGDFLLSNSMSFGRPYILKIDGCIHDGWLLIRDEKDIFDKRFLYYYLSSERTYAEFKGLAVGGVVNNLNSGMVRKVFVPFPPLPIQQKIADVLDRANVLIDKRKSQIAKLDLLMKSRFVEMFGDPLKNPMGWEVKALGSVCNRIGDGIHGTPKYDEYGEYYFINGSNLIDGKITITSSTQKVGEDEHKKHGVELDGNTILISINGSLGKTAFYNNEKLVLGKSACYCRLNSDVDKVFVYGVMNSTGFQRYISGEATASTIKNVSLRTMREYSLILPPLHLQAQFAAFVRAADKSKAEMQAGLELLELLYRSLMQKCFGGEVF